MWREYRWKYYAHRFFSSNSVLKPMIILWSQANGSDHSNYDQEIYEEDYSSNVKSVSQVSNSTLNPLSRNRLSRFTEAWLTTIDKRFIQFEGSNTAGLKAVKDHQEVLSSTFMYVRTYWQVFYKFWRVGKQVGFVRVAWVRAIASYFTRLKVSSASIEMTATAKYFGKWPIP